MRRRSTKLHNFESSREQIRCFWFLKFHQHHHIIREPPKFVWFKLYLAEMALIQIGATGFVTPGIVNDEEWSYRKGAEWTGTNKTTPEPWAHLSERFASVSLWFVGANILTQGRSQNGTAFISLKRCCSFNNISNLLRYRWHLSRQIPGS